MEFEETGNRLEINTLYGKTEAEAFPHYEEHVRSENFFRTAPLMQNSIEGLKYLNDKYKVLIVSSATEFPSSLKEKVEWLHEHFPFISWKQIILCGEKGSIKGDIMIDDHLKNLQTFNGRKIMFSQPHNLPFDNDLIQRVRSWEEIMSVL